MIATRASGRVLVVACLLAGCGDDDGTPPRPNPQTPVNRGPGAVPVAGAGAKTGPLVEKPHIEDRVGCAIPEQPSDPRDGKCDPKVPSCGEHLYCLPLAQGTYCEPCPERDGIRHAFKERDFDVEHNRDPFQSLLVSFGPGPQPPGPSKKCPREDQLVASSYSYSDLKLVGIVAQGTQRKVLMMGGPLGYIIKRGDCVGKEKAIVKDIGTGYITFLLEQETAASNQRPPEERSVQLNPKQLMINEPELPSSAPRTTIAPVVPPPAVLPPRQAPPGGAPPAPPGAASPGAGSGAAPPAPPATAGSNAGRPAVEAPPATGSAKKP